MFQILCNSRIIRTGFETEADANIAIARDLSPLFPHDHFEVWPIN